jgi:hypothetical protein
MRGFELSYEHRWVFIFGEFGIVFDGFAFCSHGLGLPFFYGNGGLTHHGQLFLVFF